MSWTHLSDTEPVARKDHECGLCGRRIPKGEKHSARRGIGDNGPETFRMHHACEARTRKWGQMEWECHDPMEFREAMERRERMTETNG
jgi:hypothetical protein